jgi:hypothetical protein
MAVCCAFNNVLKAASSSIVAMISRDISPGGVAGMNVVFLAIFKSEKERYFFYDRKLLRNKLATSAPQLLRFGVATRGGYADCSSRFFLVASRTT